MSEGPQPAVPLMRPPLLEVGFNYAWVFERYGSHIGPRDYRNKDPKGIWRGNSPPRGEGSELPCWLTDGKDYPAGGSLGKNLDFLKNKLNITKVRMFLLCDGTNCGTYPWDDNGNLLPWDVPDELHPQFLGHFRKMLETFQDKGMQILPSLVDFGLFFPERSGNRSDVGRGLRRRFLARVLTPMVEISQEFKKTIFAWEAINEPYWDMVPFRPGGTRLITPALMREELRVFISEVLEIFGKAGFENTTVGHRFLDDLTDAEGGPLDGKYVDKAALPVGSMPQFHYYPKSSDLAMGLLKRVDRRSLPTYDSLAANPRTKGAFVGEIAVGFDHDDSWPDCLTSAPEDPGLVWQRDRAIEDRAFERLKVLNNKGYKLAFVWPCEDKQTRDEAHDHDSLKLLNGAIRSIQRFTKGEFPNGMPP